MKFTFYSSHLFREGPISFQFVFNDDQSVSDRSFQPALLLNTLDWTGKIGFLRSNTCAILTVEILPPWRSTKWRRLMAIAATKRQTHQEFVNPFHNCEANTKNRPVGICHSGSIRRSNDPTNHCLFSHIKSIIRLDNAYVRSDFGWGISMGFPSSFWLNSKTARLMPAHSTKLLDRQCMPSVFQITSFINLSLSKRNAINVLNRRRWII